MIFTAYQPGHVSSGVILGTLTVGTNIRLIFIITIYLVGSGQSPLCHPRTQLISGLNLPILRMTEKLRAFILPLIISCISLYLR